MAMLPYIVERLALTHRHIQFVDGFAANAIKRSLCVIDGRFNEPFTGIQPDWF